jgi:hypothetical protein
MEHERSLAPETGFERLILYGVPAALGADRWALSGVWTVREQHVVNGAYAAHIACTFHARDLHRVMAPDPSRASAGFA